MRGRQVAVGIVMAGGLSMWLFGLQSGQANRESKAPATKAPEAKTAAPSPAPAGSVGIQMRNVNFRLANDIALEVRNLRGELTPAKPGEPVTFDDPASFRVAIDTAEVAITAEAMTALMNSYVLAYPGSPLHNVTLSIEGNKVVQRGTVHKGIDLKFEIEGSLSTTADGNIRMHAEKIKAGHVPVKGLLHLFDENLSKLVNSNSGRGMRVEGDDIILLTSTLTPPPHRDGMIARVAIQNGKIVQYFDSGKHLAALNPPFATGAYIYHRGGVLRFGKMTMNDADMQIVGDRPGFFDFFQKEYSKQLVAGYSKSTAANGLIVHMFDYSHFRAAR
jgi:hypothetical protein